MYSRKVMVKYLTEVMSAEGYTLVYAVAKNCFFTAAQCGVCLLCGYRWSTLLQKTVFSLPQCGVCLLCGYRWFIL